MAVELKVGTVGTLHQHLYQKPSSNANDNASGLCRRQLKWVSVLLAICHAAGSCHVVCSPQRITNS